MNQIITVILPILLLMVLGYGLRRSGMLGDTIWQGIDKLCYNVLLPALLISKISVLDLSTFAVIQMLQFLLLYLMVMVTLVALLYVFFRHRQPSPLSSIVQAMVRYNSYVYLLIAEQLWGAQGLALAALLSALLIPLVNFVSISAFMFGKGFKWSLMLRQVLFNPLIIGALLGLFFNALPSLLPIIALSAMNVLGAATLPLAVLSVGSAIQLRRLFSVTDRQALALLFVSTAMTLFVAPMIALTLATGLGITGLDRNLLVLYAAMPTAMASYILSRQLGGDSQLMANMISMQTLLSIFSLTFWLTHIG